MDKQFRFVIGVLTFFGATMWLTRADCVWSWLKFLLG